MPRYARGEEAAGAGWAVDAPPRHCSVSVFEPGPSFSNPPAAMQVDLAGQAAEKLLRSPSPGRSGVGWMRHRTPFHRSARVPTTAFPKLSVRAPTAVQDEADVHATVLKKLPGDPVLGVGWMVHFVPFHRSAKVAGPELDVPFRFPAAVQATTDVQDTEPRKPPGDGLGVRWMAQLLPFHRSASVPAGPPPTAVQDEADVHATLTRKLPGDPEGLGVGWMAQLLPFHRSASVLAGFPALSSRAPTATQDEADVHATPFRKPPGDPEGLGVGWMAQLLPFHRSARVLPLGVKTLEAPTAVQADGAVQSTPNSASPLARLGVGWRRHVVPFHRRASVEKTPRVGPAAPTATHRLVAGQAIAFSWFSAAPTGLGTASRPQRVPFHRSPSVMGVPAPLPWPTAVQSEDVGQDTPPR